MSQSFLLSENVKKGRNKVQPVDTKSEGKGPFSLAPSLIFHSMQMRLSKKRGSPKLKPVFRMHDRSKRNRPVPDFLAKYNDDHATE
jgi:hypothetical protein